MELKKRTILVVSILLLVINIASFCIVFLSADKITAAASTTATGSATLCNARAPSIAAISAQTATVGTAFNLQVTATFYGANTSIAYFDDSSLFNINGSGYISFTPATANIGTSNIIITVQDASNCDIAVNATTTFSLTIEAAAGNGSSGGSSGGGGGGGGGGSSSSGASGPKESVEITPDIETQEVNLDNAHALTFSWIGGETHSIKITKVGTDTATIVVSSEPQYLTLHIGESQEVDLDGDKSKDISITLLSIEKGIPKLSIKVVREGIILSDDVLKISLHQSQILEKKIVVVQDWMQDLQVGIVNSMEKLLTVEPTSFPLPVRSKQPILLTFNPLRDVPPGTYTGTVTITALAKKEFNKVINVVAEVESDVVKLDGSLDIREKIVKPGDSLRIAVSVFNLVDLPVENATLLYEIFDQSNQVIYNQEEQISLQKQASFTKTILIPKNLPPGQYVISLKMKYADSFATATEIFTVKGEEKVSALAGLASLAGGRTLLWAIPAMFVLIVTIGIALVFTRRKITKSKTQTIIKERTIQRTVVKPKTIIKRDMSEYRRKLTLLKEGHSRGYIKEDTYKKLKGKLDEIIRKNS